MLHYKLQFACILITAYIILNYYREKFKGVKTEHEIVFTVTAWLNFFSLVFDMATVYTVNHLDTVSDSLNRGLHLAFMLLVETLLFFMFYYLMLLSGAEFRYRWQKILLVIPYFQSMIVAVVNIKELRFIHGVETNYSMGITVYACFATGIFYLLLGFAICGRRWRHLEKNKSIVLSICFFQVAPMHDIGKVAVPDHILQKRGKLTEEEYDQMKTHTTKGAELIKKTFHIKHDDLYGEMAYQVALYHHEKWNGSGYPSGISGKKIPLCARIMAVADVFDAVSQDRCYRKAMTLEESFAIIEDGSGSDFDPVIAECFLNARERIKTEYMRFEVEEEITEQKIAQMNL